MKHVEVVSHDPAWSTRYVELAEELEQAFRSGGAEFHHVGSTSVRGLAAKPVIDILVEATDLDVVEAATPDLIRLGYEARGENGIHGRSYFSRPPGPSLAVHVHAYAVGHPQVFRHLVFRDYLRAHPAAAAEYGELKQKLALRHATDRGAYQEAKADFVEEIHRRAFQWKGSPSP